MTEHHFETPEPVKLYVEIGSGIVSVTAEETTETTVEVTGRRRGPGDRGQDGDQISVIAPKIAPASSAATPSSTSRSRVPTDSELPIKTGSADLTARGQLPSTARSRAARATCEVDDRRRPGARRDRLRRRPHRHAPTRSCGSRAAPATSGSARRRAPSRSPPAPATSRSAPPTARPSVKTGSRRPQGRPRPTADVSMTTGSGDLVIGTAQPRPGHRQGRLRRRPRRHPGRRPRLDRRLHRVRPDPLQPPGRRRARATAPTTSSCAPRPSAATSS